MSFNFDVQAGTSVKFPVGGKYCDRDIVVNATGTLVSGEIAITTNGTHDVAEYATANVNVQSDPVLLWTNASPTSEFAAQTVSVSGSNYDGYIIECLAYYNTSDKYCALINIGSNGYCGGETSAASDVGLREIFSTSTTSVTFGSGYYKDGSLAWTSSRYGIPTRIWGVKFTL